MARGTILAAVSMRPHNSNSSKGRDTGSTGSDWHCLMRAPVSGPHPRPVKPESLGLEPGQRISPKQPQFILILEINW